MSGRRASARSDEEQDCRAIFLSIYNDLEARMRSRDELTFALQQTGRNPTARMLGAHWKPGTRFMTFDDFMDACRRIPVTTQDDLMKAFRKMDVNGDGFVTREEFMNSMMSKGERMSMNEVMDIIDRVDDNGDGKLDYREFCNMILSNVNDCKLAAKQKMNQHRESSGRWSQQRESSGRWSQQRESSDRWNQQRESSERGRSQENARERSLSDTDDDDDVVQASNRRSSPPKRHSTRYEEEDEDDDDDIVVGASRGSLRSGNSRSDVRDGPGSKGGGSSIKFLKSIGGAFEEKDPRNLRQWKKISRRGALFLEEIGNNTKAVLTHMYSFSLRKPAHMIFKTYMLDCKILDIPPPDIDLFLVRDGQPVAFGNQTGPDGKSMLRADLKPGNYRLHPITSGVKFHARSAQPTTKAKLLKKDRSNHLALTTACKDALSDIFEIADLDGNGLLSKEEFSLYIMRTSGERLEDSLWEVVEENCKLQNGEITKEDFIQLNLKEAEHDDGDPENLWITFDSMGCNHQLFLDEAFPFVVDFYVEPSDDGADVPLRVQATEMDLDTQSAVDRALVAYVMQKGEVRSVPGAADCSVAMLASRCGAVVVAENRAADTRDIKVRSGVWLDVSCQGSENLLLGGAGNSLKTDLNLKPGHAEILFWLVPKDMSAPWKISCEIRKRS